MKAPPTRYKVVEEGRRLVVIDTHTGQPVRHAHAMPPLPSDGPRRGSRPPRSTAPLPPANRAWTGTRIRTARFFDDRGPRTIVLDDVAVRRLAAIRNYGIVAGVALAYLLIAFPWLLIFPLVALLQLRGQVRAAITRWIDGFESP